MILHQTIITSKRRIVIKQKVLDLDDNYVWHKHLWPMSWKSSFNRPGSRAAGRSSGRQVGAAASLVSHWPAPTPSIFNDNWKHWIWWSLDSGVEAIALKLGWDRQRQLENVRKRMWLLLWLLWSQDQDLLVSLLLALHCQVVKIKHDQAKEQNCLLSIILFFFFRRYNIYNVMRSGRAVMPWPGTPWAWRSVSSPTLLTSCRFFIAKS